MPNRASINYTLSTLPANGIVTAAAFNSMADAVTAVHQRGKIVLTAMGMNTKARESAFFGPSQASNFPYFGMREAGVTFQIPSGYNRFSLAAGICWPQFRTLQGVVLFPVTSLGFRSKDAYHVFHSRDTGLNLIDHRVFDGLLPIPSNGGKITNAALSMRWEMLDQFRQPLALGTGISPHLNMNSGFLYLCMALYRDDEC